ncbi:carbohydrate binding domain-containing protein [Aquimarina algiphila]|uniref:carbohydrate binding domain-containing protein n=1 Tax=Aquimarina algiphila TaxID=2047982 RepID=UPI00232E2BB4|nr:carbohydrate binding domain-containing protein [Aquimarina algiphila]
MKKITLVITLLFIHFLSFAQPPIPPSGYRWVLFDQYSDEFNGNTLNMSKWRDSFEGWQGRIPAKFDPSTISLQDGNMQIRNKKLTVQDGQYTIAGGAVQSLQQTAHFGYYECKFKASKIPMSTTFWMSNDKKNILESTKLTPDCEKDKWSQELDIIESVGGDFNQPWASGFRTKMNFNTHYRYVDCNGAPEEFYSAGNNAIEGNGMQANANLVGGESWEDFHTYGCYWKDAKTFDFYVDSAYAGTVIARTDVVDTPFSEPMGINMVTETYTFAQPYPSDTQLADNSINTSYYDWIRSYRLFPIDQAEPLPSNNIIENNGGFEKGNLIEWSGWSEAIREVVSTNTFEGKYAAHIKGTGAYERVVSLKPNTNYTLTAQAKVISGSINFGIKENAASNVAIASKNLTNTEYTKSSLEFNTGNKTNLKFFFYAPSDVDEAFADNFKLIENTVNTTEIVEVFEESLQFLKDPVLDNQKKEITISYLYKANQNREFKFRILNDTATEVFVTDLVLLEGYGQNQVTISLNNQLPKGSYQVVADIRPIGGYNDQIITQTNTVILL